MRQAAVRFLAALLLGCLSTTVFAHRYDIEIDPALALLQVRLCFAGAAPASLTSGSPRAVGYISDLRIEGVHSGARAQLRRGRIQLQNIPPGACLGYRVNLDRITDNRISYRSAGSRLVDIRTWLWRPERVPARTRLSFKLPQGVKVAGPWPTVGDQKHTFWLPDTPADWSGRVVFGQLKRTAVTVGSTDLDITLMGDFDRDQIDDVRTWVGGAADNIRRVYGNFPLADAGVLVVALVNGYGYEPVPWAEVQRSGRPEAHFFINQNAPLQAFINDWTPTHEMAHMLHPSMEWRFKWVYEGLASYYQNVARARSGQLTQQQAWQKLYDGFQRGLKQARRGFGGYMEVYWRGAAAALIADVTLRQQSQNSQSLDSALQQFGQCCFTPVTTWNGFAFFERLDRLTDSTVFSDVFGRYANSDEFPDVTPVLRELGIRVDNGRVHLTADGPWVALRTDLMTRPLLLSESQ